MLPSTMYNRTYFPNNLVKTVISMFSFPKWIVKTALSIVLICISLIIH